jgi:hypothetical protein
MCLLLKGPVPSRADGARQFCDCTPLEVRRAQPRWGGDFNTYAELCRCCGLLLLRSGSRFSIWFCGQCLEAIKALNSSAGRCLVPIGRHSFMNGVGASAAQLRTEGGARALAEGFAYLVGIERSLEGWTRTIVQRNLTELGFDNERDARLADYLDAVSSSALSPRAAFEALISAAADQPPEPGQRIR